MRTADGMRLHAGRERHDGVERDAIGRPVGGRSHFEPWQVGLLFEEGGGFGRAVEHRRRAGAPTEERNPGCTGGNVCKQRMAAPSPAGYAPVRHGERSYSAAEAARRLASI